MGLPMLDQVDHCAIGDCPGLIFAYRFRDGRAELLESRDIAAALHEPGGWIWIHLALTDDLNAVLADPAINKRLLELGSIPMPGSIRSS